jgi:hypothetical protein
VNEIAHYIESKGGKEIAKREIKFIQANVIFKANKFFYCKIEKTVANTQAAEG